MDQDPDKVLEPFVDQKLNLLAQGGKSDGIEFASSLTSLVLRLPAFDQIHFNGVCYIKMESKEIKLGSAPEIS